MNIGDRVSYWGAKSSVYGREGMIRRTYMAHGHRMFEVAFDGEVYCAWEGNLREIEEFIHISEFPPEEVSTTRGSKLPPKMT